MFLRHIILTSVWLPPMVEVARLSYLIAGICPLDAPGVALGLALGWEPELSAPTSDLSVCQVLFQAF